MTRHENCTGGCFDASHQCYRASWCDCGGPPTKPTPEVHTPTVHAAASLLRRQVATGLEGLTARLAHRPGPDERDLRAGGVPVPTERVHRDEDLPVHHRQTRVKVRAPGGIEVECDADQVAEVLRQIAPAPKVTG